LDTLRAQDDEYGIQKIPVNEIKPGDKVTIIEGPLTGYQGIYQKYKSTERVSVLLDIVGNYTEVTLSKHDLQIAENE